MLAYFAPVFGSMMRRKEKTKSDAFTGSPFDHFALFRSVKR